LVLKPGKKIVQAWRATGWWPDHYSVAIYDPPRFRAGLSLSSPRLASHLIATVAITVDGLKPTGRQ
jgi:hypothetical protein